ncbi:MAG: hypothetical protein QM541_16580 [Flavobacterium sp.]|nr:hypothetical protein [Flavobacterium sp.]
MDVKKMELRKLRNFSDNINDTFQFIKQEFKPLLGCYVAICGIFIVLSSVISGIYQRDSMAGFMRIFKGLNYQQRSLGETFNLNYFLILFLGILSYVIMHIVVAVYFKLYTQKGKISPTIEEVWKVTLRFIVPIFFYSIVYGVITFISFFFCIVPFFYFVVVFAPFTLIYVVEEKSFTDGFSRCFSLIRDNYWESLGIYIISYLIYSISAGIIGFIVSILAGGISYFATKDLAAVAGIFSGTLNIFTHIFYIIFVVSVALNYYNLVERLDGSGLLERLDSLGSKQEDAIEEQY